MESELSLKEMHKEWKGSIGAYLIGFGLSLLLTSTSFFLVVTEAISGAPLVYTLAGLALTQAACQLIFFLHLGQEAKPQWETLTFVFMFILLSIVVIGSLWIMYDLNDRVMSM